jgi:thioesterase domain-containing protein
VYATNVPGVVSAFSSLVLVQAGGGGAPFFFVHGAGGNVLSFRDVARRLGADQTVYALQARGVDGAVPLDTIEQMADDYLAAIRSVQPEGPYLLGGYSGGGVIAYEMAQRLTASGQEVALVALLDSFRAGLRPQPTPLGEHLRRLVREGPRYLRERAEAKVRRRLNDASAKLKVRFYRSQGKPLPVLLRDQQQTSTFVAASDRYRPKPYSGTVVLYRAAEVAAEFRHAGPKNGWDELTPKLEVVDVPGDHDSLVYEPNVGVLTSHLRATLHRAAGR